MLGEPDEGSADAAMTTLARRSFHPARVLPAANPRMLAWVRMVVCGILLTSALWEDLASTALLPVKMREPLGLLAVVEYLTGGAFAWLCQTAWALHAVQFATIGTLLLALVGGWTRATLPLGALLYLLMTGIIREYTSFYHTGLIPMYVLFVLAFTPCGTAWSLDRWRRRRAGLAVVPEDEPRLIDAWSVYATWMVVAGYYVIAGCQKVRVGPGWFAADNFKSIILIDALQPMHFQFDFIALIMALPDWAFTAMAVGAVGAELAMGAVLFVPRTRWILPAMMAGLHVGIWLLQRVLFFDLILIQLIFLPARCFARVETLRLPRPWPNSWPRPILALGAALVLIGLTRVEWYPISSMPMYADINAGGTIRYAQIFAVLASGAVVEARPEQFIGALRDTRYRRLMKAVKKGDRAVAAQLLTTCGELFNRHPPGGDTIVAFEMVWKRWNFVREPHDAGHGKVRERWRLNLAEAGK